jgi:hypothetical protein
MTAFVSASLSHGARASSFSALIGGFLTHFLIVIRKTIQMPGAAHP